MDMNSVLDLKPFLPAENYELAKQFYLDLGFTMIWGDKETNSQNSGSAVTHSSSGHPNSGCIAKT